MKENQIKSEEKSKINQNIRKVITTEKANEITSEKEYSKGKNILDLAITVSIIIIAIVFVYSFIIEDTEEDTQFKAIISVCEYNLKPIRQGLEDAIQSNNMTSLEYWCGQLKTSATACKNVMISEELGRIDVSSKYKSARTEYIAYLDDIYYAGYYGELGDLFKFSDYYRFANAHLDKANSLMS